MIYLGFAIYIIGMLVTGLVVARVEGYNSGSIAAFIAIGGPLLAPFYCFMKLLDWVSWR